MISFDQWHSQQARCCSQCNTKCQHEDWERTAYHAGLDAALQPTKTVIALGQRMADALKALTECPDYRGISTHEMSEARTVLALWSNDHECICAGFVVIAGCPKHAAAS